MVKVGDRVIVNADKGGMHFFPDKTKGVVEGLEQIEGVPFALVCADEGFPKRQVVRMEGLTLAPGLGTLRPPLWHHDAYFVGAFILGLGICAAVAELVR